MMVTTRGRFSRSRVDFGLLNVVSGLFFVTELVGGRSEIARQLLGKLHVQGRVDGGENLFLHQPRFTSRFPFDPEFFR